MVAVLSRIIVGLFLVHAATGEQAPRANGALNGVNNEPTLMLRGGKTDPLLNTVSQSSDSEDFETAAGEEWDSSTRSDTDNYDLKELWFGRFKSSIDTSNAKITVVMTYCDGDLDWFKKYSEGVVFERIFVAVKCGINPDTSALPEGAELVTLPNVGGCDHTMAYWMSKVLPTLPRSEDDNELVFFLKDNMRSHDDSHIIRDFGTLLDIAASDEGFACVLEPNPRYGFSFYHLSELLKGFEMSDYSRISPEEDITDEESDTGDKVEEIPFKSPYDTLADWHAALGISIPPVVTPICYGGMYLVKRSKIELISRDVFDRMTESLSRGNNIEEGHFAERTWASLFSNEVDKDDVESLLSLAAMAYPYHDSDTGSLMMYAVDLEKIEAEFGDDL